MKIILNQLLFLVVFSVSVFQLPTTVDGGKCDIHKCGPCRKHYDPVCGNDGETYSNSCIFDCARVECDANLEIAFHGECSSQEANIDNSNDDDFILNEKDDDVLVDDESNSDTDEEDEDEEDDRGKWLLPQKNSTSALNSTNNTLLN